MSETMDNIKTDFSFYRWGVLALLVALAAGGVVIMLTQSFLSGAQKTHAAAQRQLTDARRNLAAAEDDRENMAAYAEEYATLLRRNVIGNEQRLDWVDGLEDLRRQNIVLGFKYNITPQQPYKAPITVDSGNFALNMSGMTLSFNLLHEGQLVNFFNALRTNVKGFYMLDGCTIERLSGAETSTTGIAPSLKADCRGEWLTLKNRNAP